MQLTDDDDDSTHNQRDTLLVGDLGNGLEVRDIVPGVTDALDVDRLGLVVNGSSNVLGLVAVDKLGLDTQAGQENLELVVGAAVEVGGGHDVVSGVGEGIDGDELGSLAGRGGEASNTTLQGSYPLLEDIDSRLERVSRLRVPISVGRKLTFIIRL